MYKLAEYETLQAFVDARRREYHLIGQKVDFGNQDHPCPKTMQYEINSWYIC